MIIEISGPADCGKTALAFKIIREQLSEDSSASILFYDGDGKIYNHRLKEELGSDSDKITIYKPSKNKIPYMDLTENKLYDVVVIDSSLNVFKNKTSLKNALSHFALHDETIFVIINQLRFFDNIIQPMYDSIYERYSDIRYSVEDNGVIVKRTLYHNAIKDLISGSVNPSLISYCL
jgi:hypothetical protein